MFCDRSWIVSAAALVLPGVFSVALASYSNASTESEFSSRPSPYAQHVVETSNQGLQRDLSDLGPNDGDANSSVSTGEPRVGDIAIITFDGGCTEGFFCQLLTVAPAAGCLETQLSGCTTQSWCTSSTDDRCTTSSTCTQAAQCTNTQGCTDAGQCTQANGCTGTAQCTASSGCTQHSSCTNGTYCTNDAGTCTGGATCTQGTGCTNGSNCTAGSGCTKDAQCTSGATCTRGTNCTNGTNCTSGASCPSTGNLTDASDSWHDAALQRLGAPGAVSPESEPHFAAAKTSNAAAWLGLLLIPGLFVRRGAGRTRVS